MSFFLQAATLTDSHALEAVAVGAIVGLGKLWDHVKGKPRDTQLKSIGRVVGEVRDEMRDLKAHVVGPDGQNGLRSDVREIKERVIGLEERERDRLHGRYTK